MSKQKRLFPALKAERDAVSDNLYAIAYSIEDVLLQTGAIPGKDYTCIDLLNLAQPYVLEAFKGKDMNEMWSMPLPQ